ncbi:permease-like cell division protein FtsX [Oceanobacter mangrovi]|uniref:permease-like cell division protein FtsX n=1 Tax=Oceanobacter mangrovi TaxID=2862510 RepID=UPI001C8DD4A3|nr:permease-like cell division protein FtsX [Oceanobacter mangrovi]
MSAPEHRSGAEYTQRKVVRNDTPPPTRKPSSGASAQNLGFTARLIAWLGHHQLVAVETLLKLLAKPAASLLTWLVIAIALTLPGGLWMAVSNLEQLSGSVQQSGRMSVYLKPELSVTAATTLKQRIDQLPGVAKTSLVDADAALAQFRENTGLADVLDMLDGNPLPAVILVEPPLDLSRDALLALQQKLADLAGVESVELDLAWLERLNSLLALAQRIVLILGILLALAILLVVGNTIRLAIAARVDEIRVVKLVGGTNAYVRRPFLYTGLWYGMVGGVLSWILLIICWAVLHGPVAELASLYGSGFELQPLSASAALTLLLVGMGLGWFGAWWSVSRHLDEIEP